MPVPFIALHQQARAPQMIVQAAPRSSEKRCPPLKGSPQALSISQHTRLSPPKGIPSFKVVGLDRLWILHAGKPISHELISWGDKAHWTVLWQLPKDVVVPATATFYGTFQSAITRVGKTLSAEGLLLKEDIYESNNTVIIREPGESK